jgi:hypothetical protein
MNSLSIHNVVKIVVEKPSELGGDNGYCRHLRITNKEGVTISIDMFYDERQIGVIHHIES